MRLSPWLLLLLIAGCGRFGFDLTSKRQQNDRDEPGLDGSTSIDADARVSGDSGNGGSGGSGRDACTQCSGADAGPVSEAGASGSDGGNDASAPLIDAPDVTWTTDTNLSFDNTPSHSCTEGGDMVSFAVVALTSTEATLDHTPDVGCLEIGDEVLLINLQGTAGANVNVGHFEVLSVASRVGATIGFENPKQQRYGSGSDDADIGTGAQQQRVVLQRVPTYGNATLNMGATLRSYAWDGSRGGVIAMRVQGTLRIDGRIDANGIGFAGGIATDPTSSTGQQGESISGLGSASVSANEGGGGGGLGDGMGCRQSGSPGGGAGQLAMGSAGSVPDCSSVGGGAAGNESGSSARLLLGSGGGAGGTDNVRTDNPPGGQGGGGGGVIYLSATTLEGSGSIEAQGSEGQGDAPGVECNGGSNTSCWDHSGPGGGGAGGIVRIRAVSVASSITLAVAGGKGGNGNDALTGNAGDGSAGRIVRE